MSVSVRNIRLWYTRVYDGGGLKAGMLNVESDISDYSQSYG